MTSFVVLPQFAAACYAYPTQSQLPTPPPSPLLFDPHSPFCLPSTPTGSFATASLPLPIQLHLDTDHQLPHASAFRLAVPAGILATLGQNRILQLDQSQSLWDRMPYSAGTPVMKTEDASEEENVEALLGGVPTPKTNGVHWSIRNHSRTDDIKSAIFVQPPTPEREEPPSAEMTPSISTLPPVRRSSPTSSPLSATKTLPVTVSPLSGLPVPLHVLPDVRSPPRRTIAETADSLQINTRRGRRPRLFGFTELAESPSASSSAHSSPERIPSPTLSYTPSASPGPATTAPGNFIPRRHPTRARSETTLGLASLAKPKRENGLKLDLETIIPSRTQSAMQFAVIPSPFPARLIRKKSGEIVKPALKYIGPLAANGTPSASTSPRKEPPRFETKSCPTTPGNSKNVHFDAQLERIKLFNHEQKPQAVSRGGSPTGTEYTTSEGEEYPFPSSSNDDEKVPSKVLQIKLPNFPASHPPHADLFLESLCLDDERKSLKGVIQCKNLAFQKWVAVRFTLDWWQTTSEVTAVHKESVNGGEYDRFSFTIKLHDILAKIEEKTLFLAIRYNTDGREIWDSNEGQNYQVLFDKVQPVQPVAIKAVAGGRTSQWGVNGSQGEKDRIADLRLKLDRLVAEDNVNLRPQLSPRRHSGFTMSSSPMGSPRRSSLAVEAVPELPAAGLAARYDFTAALATTRRGSVSPSGGARLDLPEVQTGLLNYAQSPQRPSMGFYSPRVTTESPPISQGDYFFSPPLPMANAPKDSSIAVPALQVQGPSPPGPGNLPAARPPVSKPVLVRSSTLPSVYSSPERFSSKPETSPPILDASGSLTESTPSDSPRSPPDLSLPTWSPMIEKRDSDDSLASYSNFIEQFCWGGGAAPSATLPRRTQSASSLDNYFSPHSGHSTPRALAPKSPSGSYFTSYSSTPTRDLEHVDALTEHAVRSLGSSLSSTPLEGSPVLVGLRVPGNGTPPIIC